MTTPIFHVDAFANEPFRGNPAAVCLLERDARVDDGWMQSVAAEMQLSESCFVRPVDDGWSLRWFTPTVEVELCGHGTLASAHVLWETGALAPGEIARFHTRWSGVLLAAHLGDSIELDFPSAPSEPTTAPPALLDALGVAVRAVEVNPLHYLVEVDDEDALRSLRPDLDLLRTLDTRGVIVTAPAAAAELDFVSRYFAPNAGIPEDPVTGSAHCTLGPYWAPRLGRVELVGYQASARGGIVRVRVDGDRVHLGGRAVTVLRGELL